MTMRVCAEPGCPELSTSTRCPAHARAKDAARGRRQARGYGADHDRLRQHYQRRMNDGERFTCWRCETKGRPHEVDPSSWDLGHDDVDRDVYRGPECVAGNRATAGRISPDA